jgi:hypothetical protein
MGSVTQVHWIIEPSRHPTARYHLSHACVAGHARAPLATAMVPLLCNLLFSTHLSSPRASTPWPFDSLLAASFVDHKAATRLTRGQRAVHSEDTPLFQRFHVEACRLFEESLIGSAEDFARQLWRQVRREKIVIKADVRGESGWGTPPGKVRKEADNAFHLNRTHMCLPAVH